MDIDVHQVRRMTAARRDVYWKRGLLVLCALSLFITIAAAGDEFGLGGPPWFGWWDSNNAIAQPYIIAVTRPRADGASARSGLRGGDRIDLREQSLDARIAVLYQPMATQSTTLAIRRSGVAGTIHFVGSTVWDNASFWKLQPMVTRTIANAWFTVCALLITLRAWQTREGRLLALALVCLVGKMLDPSFVVVPSPALTLSLLMLSRGCTTVASLVLVKLASEFGTRFWWRALVEYVAYLALFSCFVADAAVAIGLLTLWLDPLPYVLSLSAGRGYLDIFACLLMVVVACAAIATDGANRARAAYLLLPLPVAFLASATLFTAPAFLHSWYANIAVIGFANAAMLIGTLAVTVTLLQRSPAVG
jgi:hypothetical protein